MHFNDRSHLAGQEVSGHTNLVDVRLLFREAQLGQRLVLHLVEELVLEELVDDDMFVRLAGLVLGMEAVDVGRGEEIVRKALRHGVGVGDMAQLQPLQQGGLGILLCGGRGTLRAGVSADHGEGDTTRDME